MKRFALIVAVSALAMIGCGKKTITDPDAGLSPSAPVLSSPSNMAENQQTPLSLAWDSVSGATSYALQVSTVSDFASTVYSQSGLTMINVAIGPLATNTTYYWKANATNAGGTSAWSGVWNFTTIPPTPGVPALSLPTSGSTDQLLSLTLSWGSVSGATSYKVQVATSGTLAGTVFDQGGITATSQSVTGLDRGVMYYWRVNATSPSGTGSWSDLWSFTTQITWGDPPLVGPANGSVNQLVFLNLTWAGVNGALSYSVQVATITGFSATVFGQAGITSTSQAVGGLANGTTYYWRVNAFDGAAASNWSGAWSFTTTGLFIQQDSIQLNPTGVAPLCAIVKYTSPFAGRTKIIVHGKTTGADLSHQFNDSGLYHTVTVAGLYPNYANTVDVLCMVANDSIAAGATVTITTGALPAQMPTAIRTTVLQSGKAEEGVNLVSNWSRSQPQIPYIVDDYGDIRWLLDFSGNSELKNLSYDNGIARLKNGNYFFGDLSTNKIYEVDILGTVINRWSFPAGYTFHHNVVEKPDGNFIATVNKMGSTHPNGVSTVEDYVIEIGRVTDALVNEWDLKVLLDENRTTLTTNTSDWFHGNGLLYDSTDNTIIVSGRTQGVVKLTYDNQVKWILAPHRGWGTNRNGVDLKTRLLTPLDAGGNPITDTGVVNGWTNHPDFEWNWYQHSPAFAPAGGLLIFDNGSSRNYAATATNFYSRAVEYRIDTVAMTVGQVWSYGKERGTAAFAQLFSSVQYLPHTNHILFCPGFGVSNAVAGGSGGKIIEVDCSTKEVVHEMEISVQNTSSFHRAKRVSLYP